MKGPPPGGPFACGEGARPALVNCNLCPAARQCAPRQDSPQQRAQNQKGGTEIEDFF